MKWATVYHPDHVNDLKHPKHGYLKVPADLVGLRIAKGWKVYEEPKKKKP